MTDPVTLDDVARAAGVSPATASRALHGSAGRTVRADLSARVLAAADALGYTVNAHARAMARGHADTVGLLVHDIADPYASAIAAGVMAAAAERGLIVTIAATLADPRLEHRHLAALTAQRARAVVIAGPGSTDPAETATTRRLLASLAAAGGRSAAIGPANLGVPTLAVDNAGSAGRLARTLHALGYRRFAVLAGPEQLVTSEERVQGFRAGLTACGVGLPAEDVIAAQFTRDGGYVAMTELLDRSMAVDAVFAVSDVMAVGAIAALRDQGHRVPRDVAMAGFDGIATLRDVEPPLTTVRLPLDAMGRQALTLALDGTAGVAEIVPVAGEVVVRASTPGRAAASGRAAEPGHTSR